MDVNPAIFICVLSGVIYMITGWIMLKYPPKKINDFYGHRTKLSKKSQKHWDFAQKESAKNVKISGYYTLLCTAPFILLEFEQSHLWVSVILVTVFPIMSIFKTEKAIKRTF